MPNTMGMSESTGAEMGSRQKGHCRPPDEHLSNCHVLAAPDRSATANAMAHAAAG